MRPLIFVLGTLGPLWAQTGSSCIAPVRDDMSLAVISKPYSGQFIVNPGWLPPGPITDFVLQAGTNLPPGITFDTKTGVLAGTPTALGMYRIYTRVYLVADSNRYCGIDYPILVFGPLSLAFNAVLPPGNAGTSYLASVAKDGLPPYAAQFTAGSLPPGLSFDATAGTLKGTPTKQGSYSFTATITDATGTSATGSFRVVIGPPGNVYVTTSSVTLQAPSGGAAQTFPVGVLATDLSAIQFAVSVPASSGGVLPGWLKVTPTSGATPSQLSIRADPTSLAAGTFQTNIQVTAPGQGAITIGIALTVLGRPSFTVAPAEINVTYPADVDLSQPLSATVQVTNNGQAAVSGTAVVEPPVFGDPWVTITPSQFNLGMGETQAFTVTIVAARFKGLYGKQFNMIDFKSSNQLLVVNVSADIRRSNSIPNITVTPRAYYDLLYCVPGGGNYWNHAGPYYVGQIHVDNPGPTTAYTTAMEGLGQSVVSTLERGRTNDPDTNYIWVEYLDACAIGFGDHFGHLPVNAPKLTPSTVYQKYEVFVVSPATGDITGCPKLYSGAVSSDSGGLVMVSQGTAKPTTTITATGSDDKPLNFTVGLNSDATGVSVSAASLVAASTSTTAGLSSNAITGVSVSPTSFVATSTPTTVTLTADPTLAPASVLTEGQILLVASGGSGAPVPQALNWALVRPAASAKSPAQMAEAGVRPAAVTCSPTQIVLVPATASYFKQEVDWPMSLQARLVDDCGRAITGASVTASFSSGDPGLALAPTDSASGIYAATWRPANTSSSVTVTLRAMKSGLPTVARAVYGAVTASTSPIIAANGVLNNVNPVLGAPLAPGTVAAIYGSNLATSTAQATTVPLPTTLGGAQVLIGGIAAPLFFASSGQINAQIPTELPDDSSPDVMVVVNGNVSVPQTIQLGAVSPGVVAYSSGRVIAQHGADYSLVTASSPARPNEWIILYLLGLGATTPAVASNQTAPATLPLATATVQPTVTIDGVAANVAFAGLTPGGIGLYQINCQVPAGAHTGDLRLVIIQNATGANAVTLPVAQ